MKKNKLLLVLIGLLVIGLLVACQAPATQAPAQEKDSSNSEAPATSGKWCSGTKIIFFPGGSPGGPFATVV